MHVGKNQIHTTVVVVVEEPDPHRSPRIDGKKLLRALAELLAGLIDPVVILALHAEHIQIEITITIQIRDRRVSTPAGIDQARRFGDVLPAPVTQVAIQNAGLGTLGKLVTKKSVFSTDVVRARSELVEGVDTDISNEQVES